MGARLIDITASWWCRIRSHLKEMRMPEIVQTVKILCKVSEGLFGHDRGVELGLPDGTMIKLLVDESRLSFNQKLLDKRKEAPGLLEVWLLGMVGGQCEVQLMPPEDDQAPSRIFLIPIDDVVFE